MQWITIFQKELLESWRNRKWIWVPLVFLLLAIMDPLSYYFLPDILDMAGGVPEGTVIDIPSLDVTQAMMMSLEEFSMFGVMIIILIVMGTIAGERKNGQSEIILVKPVRYANYLTAKWAAYAVLIWASLAFGLFGNWYYVNLLYGDVSLLLFLQVLFFYGLWLMFILTMAIFYQTLCRTPGIVAACTVATIFVLSGIRMALGHKLIWLPNQMSTHLPELMQTKQVSGDLLATSGILIGLMILLLLTAIYLFKSKEMVQS